MQRGSRGAAPETSWGGRALKLLTRRRQILGLMALLGASLSAFAQMPISAEQLRALQQLSPEERAALLQSLERPGGAGAMPTAPAVSAQTLPQLPAEVPPAEARISGLSTIVVDARLRENLAPLVLADFNRDVNRTRLVGQRSYRLDRNGAFTVPGLPPIPLAGLTPEEAAVRLSAEPLLAALRISVTLLPLAPTGQDALRPFGYSLFESRPDLFQTEPAQGIPVPRDYMVGPGDTLRIQLYGAENFEVELEVGSEGTINFPRIGPQAVAGLTFAEVKASIERRISEQLIGTQAAVSMGRLKSMRIFIVGDVRRPGAYDVSSLSRITNALFSSGGITEVGSLRRVELRRSGQLVKTLDLYALLLRGDTRNDAQLQPGDVILVPPAGAMASIGGEVQRPAIYELATDRSLGQLIELAGGLRATADSRRVQLERISSTGARKLETLDVSRTQALTLRLEAGDQVRVLPVLDDVEGAVLVDGHVSRPGSYEWFPGLRVSGLLPSGQSLKPRADLSYVLIRREQGTDRRTVVLSADLGSAQSAPGSPTDLPLMPRDTVTVFELGVNRSAAIQAILGELEGQATRDQPLLAVRVAGEVNAPGTYPLEEDMRISALLRAGGGLNPGAFGAEAELTRFESGPDGERLTRIVTVDIARAREGDPAADLVLAPYDVLTIKETPAWQGQINVQILGEVRFPGSYPVRRGELLSSVIERAGGLTDLAFPEGSLFTRQFLQEREAQQIATLANRLEGDIATLAIQQAQTPNAQSDEALSIGRALLDQLRTTQPTGRLVINLPQVLVRAGILDFDIELRDGDQLLIPPRSQEVTVLGEVQYTTSHRHASRLDRDDYIRMSGGLTARADSRRIYVVRANGAVMVGRDSRKGIQPGDTVVVPVATDRLPAVAQWSSITQIIFNLAIAAAAVNSF